MCRHVTLFYDDNTGYVIQCTECGNFQVGFGNTLLTLNATDFGSFTKGVENMAGMFEEATEMMTRSFFVPTPADGVKLLLNKKELLQLNHMLEQADTEWKSQELLHLFYKV